MTDIGMKAEEFEDTGVAEIVVELAHVELVAGRIHSLGGTVDVTDKADPALGLGVVEVHDIEVLSRKILSAENVDFGGRAPRSHLDVVLLALRRQFQDEHEGWMPEMGKNRTVQGVHGTPHIGGDSYPTVVTEQMVLTSSSDCPKVRIGLIDTRIYPNKQFKTRLEVVGEDVQALADEPFIHFDLHGTFTVGLILKQAPNAEVIAEQVLRLGQARATAWDVATAMARFAKLDVKVLILPLVCYTEDGAPPLALQRAVDLLRDRVLVVAAAGNHGRAEENPLGKLVNNQPGFPGACDGAVAVGAANEAITGKAGFNPQDAPWITLAGPGEKVVSTSVSGMVEFEPVNGCPEPPPAPARFEGSARWSGTSFATATVGAEIARRMSCENRSAADVIRELQKENPKGNSGIGGYALLQE